MRALIVEDLLETITEYFDNETDYKNDPIFMELCNRISGKEVDLVFTLGDAFETIDDNYWLPNCCWEEVE